MAFDLSVFDRPVDGEDPCGPDLDAAGDPDFTAFMARAEGLMPGSYFSFDPASFDADGLVAEATALSARTRDLRLLVILAKTLVLARDVIGFVRVVDTIRHLLAEAWETVKPLPDDGEYGFRVAPLYNLDDVGSLVFPLQFAPLAELPRVGAVTYRSHLLATGAVNPRENETVDPSANDRILLDCDLDRLVATRDALRTLGAALAGIEKSLIEKAGYDNALHLERLPPVVSGMIALLDAAVARRDPSQAAGDDGEQGIEDETGSADTAPGATVRSGPIGSQAEAAAALDAALAYYRLQEPSSPSIPLVEQARASIGRSLFEVVAMLVPDHAQAARIHVGAEPTFIVPVRSASANGADHPADAEVEPVETRGQAAALLDQVAQFYRLAEPSSPVPLLIERARSLATRDFLSLLKDILPEEALKTMKIGK